MDVALLVGNQVLLIFLYIAIGMICVKKGVISEQAGRSFSNFTLVIVTPSMIIYSYLQPLEQENLKALVLAFLLALLFHLIAIPLSMVFIRKREDIRYRIERLCVIFSNCGYIGIPLAKAALGEFGAFLAVAYISVFNILAWSAGVMILTGAKRPQWKKMILNPGCLAFLIGVFLYLTQVPVPAILHEGLEGLSKLNTPVSMISTGIFLAGIKIKPTICNPRFYYHCALRLLILPLVLMVCIKALGVIHWMPQADKVILTIVLGCACPTAATGTLFPARFGLDSEYGAKIVGMTTVFSIITIPFLSYLTTIWLI